MRSKAWGQVEKDVNKNFLHMLTLFIIFYILKHAVIFKAFLKIDFIFLEQF